MQNLKRNGTNELTYKTERDSQTQKKNLWLPGGMDSQRVCKGHAHTAIFKMDNQQGSTVQYMELYSMLCASLDRKGVWVGMDAHICMAESLPCSPETITTWLISYTPTQTKKFKD